MKPLSREAIGLALSARDVQGLDGPDLPMVFTDTRKPVPGGLFVALIGERFDAHSHLDKAVAAGAAGLVISRREALPEGLPETCFVAVVDDTREALTQLAMLTRGGHPGRFAAVTGSVGKTTVKDLSLIHI